MAILISITAFTNFAFFQICHILFSYFILSFISIFFWKYLFLVYIWSLNYLKFWEGLVLFLPIHLFYTVNIYFGIWDCDLILECVFCRNPCVMWIENMSSWADFSSVCVSHLRSVTGLASISCTFLGLPHWVLWDAPAEVRQELVCLEGGKRSRMDGLWGSHA